MKHVKKDRRQRRRKIRWKFVLPLLVLVLLFTYVIVTLVNPHKIVVVQPKYTVCDYSLSKAQAVLKTMHYDDTTDLGEHLYYGESLNLYNEPFVLGQTDPFVGKIATLVNLCDGKEYSYVLDVTIDKQIALDKLPDGFYEVFIETLGTPRQRLISQSVLYDEFYTVRRTNGLGKEVEVVADKDLIEPVTEGSTILDKNYVFIRVITKEVPDNVYDIVIDPAQYHTPDETVVRDDVNIGLALVDSANLLKQKLEAYGLKVLVTRSTDVMDRWGENGRMAIVARSKAKYYISLDIDSDINPTKHGFSMYISSYSSKSYATYIFDHYKDIDDMTWYGSTGITWVATRDFMDRNADIRETGGKILGAARYPGSSSENASFALNNPYGVQSVVLDLLWISNAKDYELYTTRHDELIEAIALGFKDFLGLEKVGS